VSAGFISIEEVTGISEYQQMVIRMPWAKSTEILIYASCLLEDLLHYLIG